MTDSFYYAAQPYTQVVVDFLNGIGLPTRVTSGHPELENVRIVAGELEVDSECPPSTLLRKAGHLAVAPGKNRQLISDNADDPDCRAALKVSEAESIAWAWAAGIHLGIPENLIITNTEREDEGGIWSNLPACPSPRSFWLQE